MANRRKEIGVQKHSHCIMCGAVIPENETLCSDNCKEDYEKMMKRQRNLRMTAFLPVIIAAIFFVVLFLFGRR